MMILGPKDRPKLGKWVVLSFQHVFAMFSATMLIALIAGLPIPVALFTSGVGTLIYIALTKAKVPIYLGSSAAFLTAILISKESVGGYGAAMTALFLVGILYVIIAVIIRFTGTKWIEKVFPPVVIGPMIMLIGWGLAGFATGWSGLILEGTASTDWRLLSTAAVSLLTVILVTFLAKGFSKTVPFLIGMLVGFLYSIIIGLADLGPFIEVVKTPSLWFKVPEFMFLWGKNGSFDFLGSTFILHKIDFSALVMMLPLAIVAMTEHIGDHKVLSEIVGIDFLEDPGLKRTLMGDGLATSFAALLGGPPNTSYGENTTVVGISRVASVWVVGLAAVMAILLSFVNVFYMFIAAIPFAVMGGVSMVLYGFIGANGLKVLKNSNTDLNKTRNIIIVSIMIVIGLGGSLIRFGAFEMPAMGIAAILGIVLNLILPKDM